MKESYLIQRLQKPFKPTGSKLDRIDNPFSFGGGLKNGGLSDEAIKLIRDIWRFDYMGSAEFEFGAVPKAMHEIAKAHGDYVGAEIQVDAQENEMDYSRRKFSKLQKERAIPRKTNKATIYVLCPLDWLPEITKRIREWAMEEPYHKTKESINLQRALFPDSDYARDYAGWLELDNGFFFFTDKEMYEKTRNLFGIVELAELKK